MTAAETYLKVGGEFVRIEEFFGQIPDENYIEGAIVARIGNQQLFGTEVGDLVDQLWAYLIDALEGLEQGEEFDGYFPDQPLRLRLRLMPGNRMELSVGEVIHAVDRDAMVETLANGGVLFFTAIKRLLPQHAASWDYYLDQSRRLLPR